MAASSMPSLRSSRRVAGVLPATDRTATEKSKRNDHERTKSRTLTQGVDRSTPADPAFEMPPKKRPRVAAPSHGQRSTRQELTPTKAGTVRHAPKGQGHTNVVTTSESRPLKAESHALPNMRPPREEKRQLRSQGGASRIKSDLALFFPCYDEMISNERRQPGELAFHWPGPTCSGTDCQCRVLVHRNVLLRDRRGKCSPWSHQGSLQSTPINPKVKHGAVA